MINFNFYIFSLNLIVKSILPIIIGYNNGSQKTISQHVENNRITYNSLMLFLIINQIDMQTLSESVKNRIIVLGSQCSIFNEATAKNPEIGYFLVPFPFLGEDHPDHIQHKYVEFLNKQKFNWNEINLRNGEYLQEFLIESGNGDYPYIYAYKVWNRLANRLHFLPIEFEAFDGANADKKADEMFREFLSKLTR